MGNNRRNLIIYGVITALFVFFAIFYLPTDLILRFNASEEGSYTFGKYIIIIIILLVSYFIGLQLYDEKNKGDYTRWYVIAGIIVGIQFWILITNII